jgi:curved DNA-binding protein CbpA
VSDSPYDVLAVPATASADEIRAAYRALVKRHHPDAPSGSADLFRAVQAAYDVIGEAEKRRKYDAVRALMDEAEQVTVSDPWAGTFAPSPVGLGGWRSYGLSSSAANSGIHVGNLRPAQYGGSAVFSYSPPPQPAPPQVRYGIQIPQLLIQNTNANLLAQYQPGQRLRFNGQDVGVIVNIQTYDDPMTRSLQITLTVQP